MKDLVKDLLLTTVVAATLAWPAAGCVEPLSRAGQHTLQAGADKQVDVLWLVRGEVLMRCSSETGTPVCTEAQGLTAKGGLASHTIRVAPDRDTDVVWVMAEDALYRCQGQSGSPVCARVEQ